MTTPTPEAAADRLRSVALGVVAGLDTLGRARLSEYTHATIVELLDILTAAERKMAALNADVVNIIDTSELWKEQGSRSPEEFLKLRTGSTGRTAKRVVSTARDFRGDFSATHQAVKDGRISPDQADVIRRECSRSDATLAAARNGGEADLIKLAEEHSADRCALEAKAWAIRTDPKGADRQWRTETAAQHFTMTPMSDGYSVRAFFTRENGNLIAKAAKAAFGRPAKDCTQTYFERLAHGITAMAGRSLDGGFYQPSARVRPHISVHAPYDTLQALINATGSAIPPRLARTRDPRTGEFGISAADTLSAPGGPQGSGPRPDDAADWAETFQPGDSHVIATALDHTLLEGVEPARLECGTPINFQLLAYLACGSTFMRIIYGPDSVILNAGREERFFTKAQTRGIYNRDRSCRFPGCAAPDHAGEIHHTNWWMKYKGTTDIEWGILLCKYHHGWVHAHEVTITRHNGKWVFTTSDGGVIRTPRHAEVARIAAGVGEPTGLGSASTSGPRAGTLPAPATAGPPADSSATGSSPPGRPPPEDSPGLFGRSP